LKSRRARETITSCKARGEAQVLRDLGEDGGEEIVCHAAQQAEYQHQQKHAEQLQAETLAHSLYNSKKAALLVDTTPGRSHPECAPLLWTLRCVLWYSGGPVTKTPKCSLKKKKKKLSSAKKSFASEC